MVLRTRGSRSRRNRTWLTRSTAASSASPPQILCERTSGFGEALRGDAPVHGTARRLPPSRVVLEPVALGDAQAAVHRDPAHQLAVRVLQALTAHLPDG